ncbi:MAG: TonB-dependent receptor plug domain-containing protein [Pseudomonadota bacterium]
MAWVSLSRPLSAVVLAIGLSTSLTARANQNLLERDAPAAECTDASCETTYEAQFFDPYAPVTALDMVNNLPGFNLDNGDSGSRGFGGAAGNILINGERVSAKSESPSDLLSRIPAADVERIIVIRGQVGGTDLRGQSVIADVIRRDGGATGAWSVTASTPHPDPAFMPSGSVSYSDQVGGLAYTLGAGAYRSRFILDAEEQVLDGTGAETEFRDEVFQETDEGFDVTANLTYQAGETRFGFNAQYEYEDEEGGEESLRQPVNDMAFLQVQRNENEERALELGFDAERRLSTDLNGKLIALYRRDTEVTDRNLARGEPEETGTITTETRDDQTETEQILRLEFDYGGFEDQLIEAAIEGPTDHRPAPRDRCPSSGLFR